MDNKKKRDLKNLFAYDGTFYDITGKAFDLILVSIYWLIGCLPVVTIGTSTAAMYAAVTRSVRQDTETITKCFVHSYRKNLKPGIPLFLIFAAVCVLLIWNYGFLSSQEPNLVVLFFLMFYVFCLIYVTAAASFAFPALSRFDMSVGWFIKLSFYLVVKRLPITLINLMVLFTTILTIWRIPILVLFLPGIGTWVLSFFIDPVLDQHMPD